MKRKFSPFSRFCKYNSHGLFPVFPRFLILQSEMLQNGLAKVLNLFLAVALIAAVAQICVETQDASPALREIRQDRNVDQYHFVSCL